MTTAFNPASFGRTSATFGSKGVKSSWTHNEPSGRFKEGNPGARPFNPTEMFVEHSFWNDNPLADDAPLHASSTTWSQNLATQLGLNWSTPDKFGRLPPLLPEVAGKAWFSINTGGVPIYVVGQDQPLVPVANHYVLTHTDWNVIDQLSAVFLQGVPIPDGAVVDSSTDKTLVIWQPSTGKYWEMWVARFGTFDGWTGWTTWGGGHFDYTYNRVGTYQNRFKGSIQIENYAWGHTATGLPIACGIITPEEWNSPDVNIINHPLHITTANASTQFITPAHRTDGGLADTTIREGCRVRLSPTTDLSWLSETIWLQFQAKKMSIALQKYGAFITDTTGGGVAFRFRNTTTGCGPISTTAPPGYSDSGTGYFPNAFWKDIPLVGLEVLDASVSPEA